MLARLLLLCALTGSLWTNALEISLGPKIKDRIVFIQQTTEAGRVCELVQVIESKTVETVFIPSGNAFEDGTPAVASENLKNWMLVRPDVAKVEKLYSSRVAVSVRVKVRTETGKDDFLDVGGWYLKAKLDPKKKAEIDFVDTKILSQYAKL